MIVIIPINGLLNRIRAILSAKLIANKLKEKLCVLWIPEKSCNCYYEHIFGNNDHLWEGVCSSDINSFNKKYNISPSQLPISLVEKNNVCTLRGHHNGEQRYMKQLISSKCLLKIIKAGGNFQDPDISKDIFNKQKMELYSQLIFSNAITENIPIIPEKTLGLHLRFTDRSNSAPSSNQVLNSVNDMLHKNSIQNIKIVSDDLQIRGDIMKILQEKYPNINVSVTNIITTTRQTYQGLQSAMLDWITLCHCDSLIFSTGSSFGYEAFISNLNRDVEEIPSRQLLK